MTTKRLPLRDALARIERRDPVLPALLSLEASSHPESEPEPRPATGSLDRRTVSVDVRVDRDVFVRYRTLQHELRQDGHEEPTLRSIVSALLERLPSDPEEVHHRVTTWRASDPASQRPYAERDLHRLRVDVPTALVRRVEAMLFRLEVEGRALALTDVIRACLAQGPRCSGELTALLADSDGVDQRTTSGTSTQPPAETLSEGGRQDAVAPPMGEADREGGGELGLDERIGLHASATGS